MSRLKNPRPGALGARKALLILLRRIEASGRGGELKLRAALSARGRAAGLVGAFQHPAQLY